MLPVTLNAQQEPQKSEIAIQDRIWVNVENFIYFANLDNPIFILLLDSRR
jgi:hypothetical protein